MSYFSGHNSPSPSAVNSNSNVINNTPTAAGFAYSKSLSSNNSQQQSQLSNHHRHISIGSLSSITSSASTLASSVPLDPNQVSVREENDKLNKRLHLLRDEYVKLQTKHSDLQARYDRLASLSTNIATDGDSGTATDYASFNSNYSSITGKGSRANSVDKDSSVVFVSKVLDFIASLFNNQAYSDLTVTLAGGEQLYAHKFVLKFRSLFWGPVGGDLEKVDTLELPDLTPEVGLPLFKWIYSGSIALNTKNEEYILGMFALCVIFVYFRFYFF